jgi:hypothetical protein
MAPGFPVAAWDNTHLEALTMHVLSGSSLLASSGEISVAFRPASQPAELITGSGVTVRYLTTGASTNGEFGLCRLVAARCSRSWRLATNESYPPRNL